MSWLTAFYVTNTASGLVLALLGWLAAVRPHRYIAYCLPLFLLAFGTQFIASNSATAAHASATAYVLFLLSAVLGPIQAAMLLGYVQEESEGRHPAVRRIARLAAAVVTLSSVAGAVLAIVHPSSVLMLRRVGDGYTAEFGWASAFFDGPQFIGVALATLLLACITSTTDARTWKLHTGLAVAIAVSYGWPLGAELSKDSPAGSLLVTLAAAWALLLGAGILFAWRARSLPDWSWLGFHGGATANVCFLAVIAGLGTNLRYLGPPGLWRLLAAAFLIAPAIVSSDWRRHLAQARNWPYVLVVLLAWATAAIGVLGHLGVDFPGAWRLLAVATSLAALAGIGLLSLVPGIQVLRDRLPMTHAGGA